MTTLRTIFAVIGADEGVECALNAYKALPLTDRSKLIGLHVSPMGTWYGLATDVALASYIEAQIETAEDEQKSAGVAFARACEQAQIPCEWRPETALSYLVLPHAGSMARAADLIIFPQSSEASSTGRHQLEAFVFTSGRPVLGLPAGWSGSILGERVLIAWDGGREAARAVFDAMPLLLQAKAVRIVSVQSFWMIQYGSSPRVTTSPPRSRSMEFGRRATCSRAPAEV